jgi:hypothetical protein
MAIICTWKTEIPQTLDDSCGQFPYSPKAPRPRNLCSRSEAILSMLSPSPRWVSSLAESIRKVLQLTQLSTVSAKLGSFPTVKISSDLKTLQFWTNQIRLLRTHHIMQSPNQGRWVIHILQQQEESYGRPTSAPSLLQLQLTLTRSCTGSAQLITCSPYKIQLQDSQEKKPKSKLCNNLREMP